MGHFTPHTKESKRKISIAKKGKHCSPKTEFKKGQTAWNKGKPMPWRTCSFPKGHIPWNKGKKGLQNAWNKGLHPKRQPNWCGGKSFELYPINWTETLKRAIRERDNYICKLCGKTQIEELEKLEVRLSIHHIDYDKKNCNLNNLITLCKGCNAKVNFNREYWKQYFNGGLE